MNRRNLGLFIVRNAYPSYTVAQAVLLAVLDALMIPGDIAASPSLATSRHNYEYFVNHCPESGE